MKLKICGNHSAHDVKVSFQSDAQYIGFVFAASKRQVQPEHVQQWLHHYPLKERKQIVGVFVNEDIDMIERAVNIAPLDVVQLHGTESPEFVTQVKARCDVGVWKVIHHADDALHTMEQYSKLVDGYLIDNKTDKAWGGTGTTFNWTYVPNYIEKAHHYNKLCFIAGGINPTNVNELIKFKPDGIDLASGVETELKKDKQKIMQLQECIDSYVDNITE